MIKFKKSWLLFIGLVLVAFLVGRGSLSFSLFQKEEGSWQVNSQLHPLAKQNLKAYAQELGLEMEKFNQCLEGGKYAKQIAADWAQAQKLGVRGTPGFFINGRFLAGLLPLEAFREIIDQELAGKGGKDYSKNLQQLIEKGYFKPQPQKVEVRPEDASWGPQEAPITWVEFSDFQCPVCIRAHPLIKQLLEEYPGKIRFVYKHLPLRQIHPYAQKAAEASLCAKEQGKFWEYHDKLFTVQANNL